MPTTVDHTGARAMGAEGSSGSVVFVNAAGYAADDEEEAWWRSVEYSVADFGISDDPVRPSPFTPSKAVCAMEE
eukprot:12420968-Karenia_brevis.AAC.1